MKRRGLLLFAAAVFAAAGAHAATTPLTLDQVESRYPMMSPVHIEKCDHDGDGLYTRSELVCVNSIYDAMYRDR